MPADYTKSLLELLAAEKEHFSSNSDLLEASVLLQKESNKSALLALFAKYAKKYAAKSTVASADTTCMVADDVMDSVEALGKKWDVPALHVVLRMNAFVRKDAEGQGVIDYKEILNKIVSLKKESKKFDKQRKRVKKNYILFLFEEKQDIFENIFENNEIGDSDDDDDSDEEDFDGI